MATIDYASLLTTVTSLITQNGRSCVVQTDSQTLDDADKPWGTVSGDPVDISVTGIFSDVTEKEIDDEIVKKGFKKLILEGSVDASVKSADRVIDGAEKHSIVLVKEVKPASTPLLYILYLEA